MIIVKVLRWFRIIVIVRINFVLFVMFEIEIGVLVVSLINGLVFDNVVIVKIMVFLN